MEITRVDSYSELGLAGSHRVGTLRTAPATLIKGLGSPSEDTTDDSKISGEYYLILTIGNYSEKITIYDYKATSLYSGDEPDPEDFWASTEEFDFSVGSDADIILLDELEKHINVKPILSLVKNHG